MPRLDGEGGLPKGFNAIWVKNAPPKKHKLSQDGPHQISYFENLRKGLTLVLVCSFKGTKTWRALVYLDGTPRSFKLGTYPKMSLQEAYAEAREFHDKPGRIPQSCTSRRRRQRERRRERRQWKRRSRRSPKTG